jgi:hypothetical protein
MQGEKPLAFIVAFVSAAVVFLLWAGKDRLLQKFQLLRVTADARWWVAMSFVLLVYFGWSDMQIGHDARTKQQANLNYLVLGPDPWEGRPLAIAWWAATLREPVPRSPLPTRFIVNARNVGSEPIKIKGES